MHFAAPDVETHVVVGDDPREFLADALHLEDALVRNCHDAILT